MPNNTRKVIENSYIITTIQVRKENIMKNEEIRHGPINYIPDQKKIRS